jgi:hypothetical protein
MLVGDLINSNFALEVQLKGRSDSMISNYLLKYLACIIVGYQWCPNF